MRSFEATMAMQSAEIYYRSSIIHFIHGDHGTKPVVCFHGYGEESGSFDFFEKYVGNDFLFIAIDLPFHGQTKWNEKGDFTIRDLHAIIKIILQQFAVNDQIILIGYSLGGRITLCLYQEMHRQIEKLVLLAPDGLKVNFWYWLSTQTWMGNRLFYFTMKYPGWFFGFLKLLNTLGLVNASIFKFVNFYIGDKKVRQQLYDRWTCLRKLKPRLSKIKSCIKKNDTRVRLIYGKLDRIILPARGEKFCRNIEPNCRLSIIHSGHQVLHEKYVNEILPALSD